MPGLIPLWKLRRELVRLGTRISHLPATLAALPVRLGEPKRRARYERDFDRLTRLTEGGRASSVKVAIFLIYQPKGVAASVLATCEWLASEGYAPFVVSNGMLDDGSRALLTAQSWRLLERPNFGYDFGGYRDAILLMSRWGVAPERLAVMNDSIWLPMVPDLMARIERRADAADIIGLLQDEKVRHDTGGGQPTDQRHLGSFFYLFTPQALQHPDFRAFWRDYRMTDFKPDTIKFGELAFSSRMEAAGLRLEALSLRGAFLDQLAAKDDAFLALTLRYAAYGDPDLARVGADLAKRDPTEPGWRKAALDHIRRSINRKRFNASFPYANDQIFGTLFMKKSNEAVFAGMRAAYVRAVATGDIAPPPAVILAEVQAMVDAESTPGAKPL